MKKYIGIDISKATIDVYNGKKGFQSLVALSDNMDNTTLIFELTGVYSYALTPFCEDNSIHTVIVGPRESREFARSQK